MSDQSQNALPPIPKTLAEPQPTPAQPAKEEKFISPRALSIARQIDNFPAGTFEITIRIPEIKAAAWLVEVTRIEQLHRQVMPKHTQE